MVHHLMLTRDPTATPEDPGKIFLCHRLSRYEAVIGQPTSFDNQLHAFIGDSSNGQPPITIIMPTDFLHAANAVQVYTVAKLQQLSQDNPDAQLVGPFTAGDDDTEPVHVCKCVWIPNRYALLVFGDGVSPRLAWERIYLVVRLSKLISALALWNLSRLTSPMVSIASGLRWKTSPSWVSPSQTWTAKNHWWPSLWPCQWDGLSPHHIFVP
jgi:hypothetical protein